MLAMIAGLHSPRRKPQVNAIDQGFGTDRLLRRAKRAKTEAWSGTVASRRWVMWTNSKGHVSSTTSWSAASCCSPSLGCATMARI